MKIEFKSFDQIKKFLKITKGMESDVLIKHGNLQLDAKSPLGMMAAPLFYPMTVYVMEKEGTKETDMFIKECSELNIICIND